MYMLGVGKNLKLCRSDQTARLELGTRSKGNMVNYVVRWQLCNEHYGPMTKKKKKKTPPKSNILNGKSFLQHAEYKRVKVGFLKYSVETRLQN